ncbi:unnamed protein product [Cercospora beticola]|nr:unnamed protein product [Cercospora beticola]
MLHLLHTSGDPSCCDSQRFLACPCLAPHLPAAALLPADPAEQARRHDAQQLRPSSRRAISRHQTSPPARGSLLSIGARRPRRPLPASFIRPPKLKQSKVGYPNLDDSPNYQRTSHATSRWVFVSLRMLFAMNGNMAPSTTPPSLPAGERTVCIPCTPARNSSDPSDHHHSP